MLSIPVLSLSSESVPSVGHEPGMDLCSSTLGTRDPPARGARALPARVPHHAFRKMGATEKVRGIQVAAGKKQNSSHETVSGGKKRF